MSILVVGSTGLVGGQVARKLPQRHQSVRALVRGGAGHAKAKELRDASVEIADGDLTHPQSLDQACRGIATVVSTATSMPSGANDGLRRVDHQGTMALIDAAQRAGVGKFVYVSYSGNIREDSPLETAKRACENRLLESSMQAVILRPSYFMEVWLSPALGFDPAGGSARIYGLGEAKESYISAFDVADFAVEAAVRSYAGKNTILELGGPEPLSQLDAVRIFEQALNKEFRLEFVPIETLRAQHQSPDPLQKSFAALMLGYAKGDVINGATALARDYGITLRAVADHASSFRAQARSAP